MTIIVATAAHTLTGRRIVLAQLWLLTFGTPVPAEDALVLWS